MALQMSNVYAHCILLVQSREHFSARARAMCAIGIGGARRKILSIFPRAPPIPIAHIARARRKMRGYG